MLQKIVRWSSSNSSSLYKCSSSRNVLNASLLLHLQQKKKKKKLISPHCSWATLRRCEFIFVWTNLEWQTKLADHYLVAVLCGPIGEEHLRLSHKGREFFAFPPTVFGTSLDNNCGHYSWPPARDAHPLSLAPTGSLKLLLPDSTACWNICPVWFDQRPLKCFFYGRDLFLFLKIFLWKKSLIWHACHR